MTEAEVDPGLVESARNFLLLFSPDKPPRYGVGGERVRNPVQMLGKALDEAQFVLNQSSSAAIRNRSSALSRRRRIQIFINALHFVTASSFALLLADQWPQVMKWVIPGVSLTAGILGIALPALSPSNERQLFADIDRVSELSGRIVSAQTQLRLGTPKQLKALEAEILSVLDLCTALAKRYELDQVAAAAGSLPRPELSRPPEPPKA